MTFGRFHLKTEQPRAIGVWRFLPFPGMPPGSIQDLEEISYDPNERRYVAIASHRRYNAADRTIAVRERHLLRFTVECPQGDCKISAPSPDSIDVAPALAAALQALTATDKSANGWAEAVLEAWKTTNEVSPQTIETSNPPGNAKTANQRYGLEIEGLAYRDGVATLGLKYPLLNGQALLANYVIKGRKIVRIWSLPLDNMGISALAWDGPNLLIVANPTAQEQKRSCDDPTYGESRLYVSAGGTAAPRMVPVKDLADPCGQLEGLAVVRDELLLVYEGVRPQVKLIPRPPALSRP